MHAVLQDIDNEGGSWHKTNQQHQHVDFNASEMKKQVQQECSEFYWSVRPVRPTFASNISIKCKENHSVRR